METNKTETTRLSYVRQAEIVIAADPDHQPNFSALIPRGHAAARFLRNAQRTDGDAPYLYVLHTSVFFSDLLDAQVRETERVMGEPGARIPAPVHAQKAMRLEADEVLVDARGVNRRVRLAVRGNGSPSEAKRKLSQHLFSGLGALPTSRDGLHSYLGLLLGRIQGLKDSAPPALRELVPLIEEKLRALDEAPDAGLGRRSTSERLSKEAAVALLALDLILSELMSWAAAKASDERLNELERILIPAKRRQQSGGGDDEGEEGGIGDVGKDAEKKPAANGASEPVVALHDVKKVVGG